MISLLLREFNMVVVSAPRGLGLQIGVQIAPQSADSTPGLTVADRPILL
jgi:hypothetical protein